MTERPAQPLMRPARHRIDPQRHEIERKQPQRLNRIDDEPSPDGAAGLGERLEVLWEREVGARPLGDSTWEEIASRGFDDPQLFSAYLHTLRWNCVTSTNARLFQAPYRAGIEVKAYQLEPLRKALQMPRVGLFIADDVGLGKTIEAGLILRELLMRQKVRRVLIACPPSVVRQWQEEMEQRFGLPFVIYDREFVAARRQERGYGVNPFSTHTRFILSHALLRDETYAAPLREAIRRRIRETLSPRFVPDAVEQVAEVPRTLTGKKQELPVKKLLLGRALADVVNPDACANPGAFAWYEAYARQHATATAAPS